MIVAIKRIWMLSFSPTGNTERIARRIGEIVSQELDAPLTEIDFTTPAARAKEYHFTDTDLLIAAFPTYAGKLPNKILPDLKARLHGDHTLSVSIVTFGNRAFDNSLAELAAVLTGNGFRVSAAAAFVSRHAFTDAVGTGRPDTDDWREIEAFAKAAAEKIQRGISGDPAPLSLPGDAAAPYYIPKGTDGQPVNFLKAKPKTDPSRCCNCGVCARRCPMGAIDPQNVFDVPGICIKCQSCVRRCTRKAKFFDDPAFLSHVAMLEQNYKDQKENQTFV